jgi:hypothetical protein
LKRKRFNLNLRNLSASSKNGWIVLKDGGIVTLTPPQLLTVRKLTCTAAGAALFGLADLNISLKVSFLNKQVCPESDHLAHKRVLSCSIFSIQPVMKKKNINSIMQKTIGVK